MGTWRPKEGLIKDFPTKRDKKIPRGKKQCLQKVDETEGVWKAINKRKTEKKDMKYSMFEI